MLLLRSRTGLKKSLDNYCQNEQVDKITDFLWYYSSYNETDIQKVICRSFYNKKES